MPLFEVKMPDGTFESFNPDWVVRLRANPQGGTVLEIAGRNQTVREVQVPEPYETVRERIRTAFQESAGYQP